MRRSYQIHPRRRDPQGRQLRSKAVIKSTKQESSFSEEKEAKRLLVRWP